MAPSLEIPPAARAYLTYVDDKGVIKTLILHRHQLTDVMVEDTRKIMVVADSTPLEIVHSITEWFWHIQTLRELIDKDVDNVPRITPELPEDFKGGDDPYGAHTD